MVTDYDCWNQNCKSVSVEMVIKNLHENAEFAKLIISAVAKRIALTKPKSNSHKALCTGLMTPKEQVSKKTLSKVSIFTDSYWM